MKFICQTSDIAADAPKRVELEGRAPLAVFKVDDQFFVTDDICTHGQASLCDGELDGHEIECPFHQGTFDIRSGKPMNPPCSMPLRVYPVRIEEGRVMAQLDE